jgi:hypothetical protein
MAAILAATALGAAWLDSRDRDGALSGSESVDSRAVRALSTRFAATWLADDWSTGESFACEGDRGVLRDWWRVRRAALVAGFGTRAKGKVSAVEIIDVAETAATVRLTFEVQAREQLMFLDWKKTADGWRIKCPPAHEFGAAEE